MTQTDSLSPGPGFWRKNGKKLAASAVMTACMLYGLAREDFSLLPPKEAFAQVKWWVVPIYVVTLFSFFYVRATRWRFLLRSFAELPLRRLIAVSWISFAAILILPFRIGEFVRPVMIREKGKISLAAATGTIVAERIVDGLFVSGILAAALLWVKPIDPLPETVVGLPSLKVAVVRGSGFAVLGVFAIAFTVIAVYYFARNFARLATLKVFGLVSKPLAEKLAAVAENLANGLNFLGRPKDALPFLFETALYWGINIAGMWLLAWGCGVKHGDGSSIQFVEAAAIMGMLGATILIPGPPGLLGLFHVGVVCGMTLYFPANIVQGPGAAFSFILYVVQLVCTVGAGLYWLRDPKERAALRTASEAA